MSYVADMSFYTSIFLCRDMVLHSLIISPISLGSLFIFPSLTAGLKLPFRSTFLGALTEWDSLMHRPFMRVPKNVHGDLQSSSVSNLLSEQLMKMLIRPPGVTGLQCCVRTVQVINVALRQEARNVIQAALNQKPKINTVEDTSVQSKTNPQVILHKHGVVNFTVSYSANKVSQTFRKSRKLTR